MLLTVSQAAYVVRRDQRAVRYAIAKGHLTAETGDDGYMRLDSGALASVRGWTVDPARLADVAAEEGRTARSLAARLAVVERRLLAVEHALRAALGETTRSDGQEGAAVTGGALVTYPDAPRRPSAFSDALAAIPARAGHLPPLPDGLVSVASFAEAHGVPRETWQKALRAGRLPTVEGEWRVVRSLTRHALDAEGRRVFFTLWGHRATFRRCADCPHG